jgi:hypothetical protein
MTTAPAQPPLPAAARLAVVGAGALLLAHVTMTFLHVTPVNPVKVEYEAVVSRWTEPLFDQNWKLFAPDPIAVDQGLLVRARLADGSVTEYVDIVSPYLEAKHHNLLPTRAGYQVSGVISRFLETRESALATVDDAVADEAPLFLGDDVVAQVGERERYSYREALADLRDSAFAHLPPLAADVESVQLRIVQHEFPRYSKRHDDGLGSVHHATSEWLTPGGVM